MQNTWYHQRYHDNICDVAERKYGFENSTTDNCLDFCINNGFITPVNSIHKICYRLVATPDINVDDEDWLTSTVVENPQLVIPGSATSSSSLNKGRCWRSSNFSNRASLINDNGGKSSSELSFNLDQGMDVNLDLEGNMDTKNLLLFYKQKLFIRKSKLFSINPFQDEVREKGGGRWLQKGHSYKFFPCNFCNFCKH